MKLIFDNAKVGSQWPALVQGVCQFRKIFPDVSPRFSQINILPSLIQYRSSAKPIHHAYEKAGVFRHVLGACCFVTDCSTCRKSVYRRENQEQFP